MSDLSRRDLISSAAAGAVVLAAANAHAGTGKPAAAAAAAANPKPGGHAPAPLPFKAGALTGISEKMITSHHDKNYAGAVKNLNKVETDLVALGKDAAAYLVAGLREKELTYLNSMILHERYFGNLGGDGKRSGALDTRLGKDFGADAWEAAFKAAAMGLGGGSGWVVLSLSFHDGDVRIASSANHTQAIAHGSPLLVLDMYEHAYAIDYGADHASYIDAFFKNVAWHEVEDRYDRALEAKAALGSAPEAPEPGLARLAAYFLRLGALGFGGPIALAGYMQRDLVERRAWIAPDDFKQGLALAQLAPGPLAAQLAIYLGWVRARIVGATVVAFAFVLPSFLMVLGLSALYVHFGGLAWMQGLFYGVGAAVIAIIGRSAVKLGKMTLGKRRLLWLIAAGNAAAVAITEQEIIWLFLASGVIALAAEWPRARAAMVVPPWLLTGIGGIATGGTLVTLFLFFAQAGAVVFGSGLAIVPFLHGGVVEQHHWLTDQQFLDAVAVAMITPGPVVITVAFIGYLVAGPLGATAAAAGVFLPCWLFVIVPAPYFRRFADHHRVRAFVDGVTAAAAGAIGGAAIVLGRRAIVDVPTALIGLAALAAIMKIKRLPEPLVIVAAGVIGLAVRSLA